MGIILIAPIAEIIITATDIITHIDIIQIDIITDPTVTTVITETGNYGLDRVAT